MQIECIMHALVFWESWWAYFQTKISRIIMAHNHIAWCPILLDDTDQLTSCFLKQNQIISELIFLENYTRNTFPLCTYTFNWIRKSKLDHDSFCRRYTYNSRDRRMWNNYSDNNSLNFSCAGFRICQKNALSFFSSGLINGP